MLESSLQNWKKNVKAFENEQLQTKSFRKSDFKTVLSLN